MAHQIIDIDPALMFEKGMKSSKLIFRLLRYLAVGLLVAIIIFFINVNIPRSLGGITVHRVSLVTGNDINRVENDPSFDLHPEKWLRIEISSERDLTARAREAGGSADLYIHSNCCPMRESMKISASARGPFPDDLPVFLPFRQVSLPNGYKVESDGDGYRHAIRKTDLRYHYTIYVDADNLGDASRDLRLRIEGVSMFSPHAESDILTIPSMAIRQALQGGFKP